MTWTKLPEFSLYFHDMEKKNLIQLTPEGRFFIREKQETDLAKLGEAMLEWNQLFCEERGWIPGQVEADNIKCDCGGAKSNTTHARWCSTYQT